MITQLPSEERLAKMHAETMEILGSKPRASESASIEVNAKLFATMCAALLAAYEQEPVAYAVFANNGNIRIWSTVKAVVDGVDDAVPLYTHPAPSIPASGYDNIKGIESAIAALKRTITEARRFRYCLGALMNLDDEVAKLKVSASLSAPSIPAVPDFTTDMKLKKAVLWLDGVIKHNPGMKEAVTCRAAMLQSEPEIHDDTRRMDWLVSKTVNVREPMVYGSHDLFWSQTISEDWEEEHKTTLREQIDAAMAAAPKGV